LSDAEAARYTIDGSALSKSPLVKTLATNHGENVYQLAAGSYAFTVTLKNS
jgi:hypothetical protein